jgi:transposase-like protein
MRIRLILPDVKTYASSGPGECPYCHGHILHIHQRVSRRVIDPQVDQVQVVRWKCTECGRSFRHYPEGVSRKQQSKRLEAVAAILWGLGLPLAWASQVLEIFGVGVGKTTVWRDVQGAGQALRSRKRCPGVVRVVGADETLFKVRGREVSVGFVVGEKGELIGFDLLTGRDAQSFEEWLREYVQGLGVEVVVTDDLATYKPVLEQLGVEQQLCLAHLRKNLARRLKGIEGYAREKERLRQVVKELPPDGGEQLVDLEWALAREGERAKKLKGIVIDLAQRWRQLTCFLRREGVPSTNNACERVIGRSKVRYKTMRGYKSDQGMLHGIALTQWLGSGAQEYRLEELLVA